ncbi:hypothetical protein [Trinickia symbiotica]|uniref:hypothetical protein n=1 Tax=Trinickia symbiotica TaxID=863227 RepID=UPI0015E7516F|nr:hypothetical protein [Trinickia symbiotica]
MTEMLLRLKQRDREALDVLYRAVSKQSVVIIAREKKLGQAREVRVCPMNGPASGGRCGSGSVDAVLDDGARHAPCAAIGQILTCRRYGNRD